MRTEKEDKHTTYWNFHFVQAVQEDVVLVESITSPEEQALAATHFLNRALTGPDVERIYLSREHVKLRKIIKEYSLFKIGSDFQVRALNAMLYTNGK